MSLIKKLTPIYKWDTINSIRESTNTLSAIEIAAAPIPVAGENHPALALSLLGQNVSVFLNGELKHLGQGDPASNFRYKFDSEMNNSAISNIVDLMKEAKKYGSRIHFPSFSRDDRYITFKMEEDGDFTVSYANGCDTTSEKAIINKFLTSFGIGPDEIKRIRLSSESAGFRTKLADIQSLLLQVDVMNSGNLMEEKSISLKVVLPTSKEVIFSPETRAIVEEKLILRETTLPNGRKWNPIQGNNYLYFQEPTGNEDEDFVVSVPKDGSIHRVYQAFWDSLNDEENDVKKSIREHFRKLKNYHRWSDYSVNDTDDAFTILAILRAYHFAEVDEEDEFIRSQFREIIQPWFDDLYSTE